ncbi:hypothetical protein NBE98_09860 [Clostridium swellfunianum]|uniref:hypothetical protein n=1 Tax=Clostridium swellfunianum TaxID=1367462 RepID=UPI0020304EEE|nr:hypothetical protein [Clostridium swellfunianum]MCM0648679.1 hypothetical protein [Clostridium swellfunianum]
MAIKVRVSWPNDREDLEIKVAEVLAEILVKKLNTEEVEVLIEILKDDSVDLRI